MKKHSVRKTVSGDVVFIIHLMKAEHKNATTQLFATDLTFFLQTGEAEIHVHHFSLFLFCFGFFKYSGHKCTHLMINTL